MPTILSPITKNRVYIQPYDVDVMVTYEGESDTIKNEDVPDFTGTGLRYRGNNNKLRGTRGAILGKKSYALTNRGNRAETMKQDARVVYVKIK